MVNLTIAQTKKLIGLILFVFFLTALFTWSAHGAEWKLDPFLSVRGEFHDNLTLTSEPHDSVWGSRIIPAFKFQYSTEIVKIFLDSSVEFVRFFGDKNTEKAFTNGYFPLTVDYTSEKDHIVFLGTFIRDFTTQSELDETGVVVDFQQRTRRQGEVTWNHSVSEQFTFNNAYAFSDVTYEKGADRFGLFDFQGFKGSLGGTYAFTEKGKISSRVSYAYSQSPDVQNKAHNIGLGVGGNYEFSETLGGSLATQGRYVFSESEDGSSQDFVWLLNGSLKKSWERTDLTGLVGRNLNQSGRGVLRETNRAGLILQHQITESLSGNLNANAIFSRTLGSSSAATDTPDTFYWRIRSGVSWRWSERWRTDLSYSHRQRRFKGRGDSKAVGNTVSFQLTYDLPELSIDNWPEIF